MATQSVASTLIIRDPFDGSEIGRETFANSDQIATDLSRAIEAQARWKRSSAWERSQLLLAVATELERRHAEFSTLIAREAGKPITYARAETDRAIGVLRWASAEAQRFAGELLRLDTGATGRPGFGIHQRFPRGVILGITPFNFPLNLTVHKIAPAIASGCSILIKPSPATPLTARLLASLFESASPGLVQVVIADDAQTEALTRAPEIAMISFTGSARVGALIREQAPHKPMTLELGGNAWTVVLEDTPREKLAQVARRITAGAFAYAGQSCISVQNVAVQSSIWDALSAELQAATRSVPYGNTMDDSVVSGPVINEASAKRIEGAISSAPRGWLKIRSSAQPLESSGSPSAGSGILAPTLLMTQSVVGSSELLGSPLIQEEIFGPVMTASRFDRLEEVITQINSSRYGLQAGIFTESYPAIERLYADLHVGGVVINDIPTTRYDHQPYGGVKDSGQGREGVRYAMEDMTESKFLALSSRIP